MAKHDDTFEKILRRCFDRFAQMSERDAEIFGRSLREIVPGSEESAIYSLSDDNLDWWLGRVSYFQQVGLGLAVVQPGVPERASVELAQNGFAGTSLGGCLFMLGWDRIPVDQLEVIQSRLESVFRGMADDQASFVSRVGGALGIFLGRFDEADALLRAFAGLKVEDFSDLSHHRAAEQIGKHQVALSRARLRKKLEIHLCDIPLATVTLYISVLARMRAEVTDTSSNLAVLETWLGIEPADYTPGLLKQRFKDRLAFDDPDRFIAFTLQLHAENFCIGCFSEAQAVLLASLDLDATDSDDVALIWQRIAALLHSMTVPDYRVSFISSALTMLGSMFTADAVMNALGLSPRDDLRGVHASQNDFVRMTVEIARDAAAPGIGLTAVLGLADFLGKAERPLDGMRVIAAFLIQDELIADDPVKFVDCLADYLPRQHVVVQAFALQVSAGLLKKRREIREMIRLLAPAMWLLPSHLASSEMIAAQLRQLPSELLFGERIALVTELVSVLETGAALRLTDAFLWRVVELDRDIHLLDGAPYVAPLLDFWFEQNLTSSDPGMLEKCRKTVRYLRALMDESGRAYADRSSIAEFLAPLRRKIITAGMFQASLISSDAESPASAVRIEVLLHDIELGQRILFERYRFRGGNRPSDPLNATVSHTRWGWSCDANPPADFALIPAGVPQKNSTNVGRLEARHFHVEPQVAPRPADDPHLADIANIVRRGVAASDVAQVLGVGTVLLHLRFLQSGELHWIAVRAVPGGLEELAHWKSPSQAARKQIASAVRFHDNLIEAIWSEAGSTDGPLRELCQELIDDPRLGSENSETQMLKKMDALEEHCRSSTAGLPLAEWLSAMREEPINGGPNTTSWSRIIKRFKNLSKLLASDATERKLDALTFEFLQWVAVYCQLQGLEPHLSPTINLVVDPEDVLHAVPLAFLPIAQSGYLCNLTGPIRCQISLLLMLLQKALLVANGPAPADAKMALVSWFPENDPQRHAVAWAEWALHVGQTAIARQNRLDLQTASNYPAGTSAAISEITADHRSIRTLTICGHGHQKAAGIALSDAGLWDGSGCRLENVELLVLISCSIGRVNQMGETVPDVAGFVTNLLASRMASAVAAKWPVHAIQSVLMANLLVSEFLAMPQAGTEMRAIAMMKIRQQALQGELPDGVSIGLNTLSAFELYGQG